ncbi:MAG: L,D-transpeptidase [Polyangiaceae bacterium]|nr:L,D-transpeptidase [Polyangiaceae bacterium]
MTSALPRGAALHGVGAAVLAGIALCLASLACDRSPPPGGHVQDAGARSVRVKPRPVDSATAEPRKPEPVDAAAAPVDAAPPPHAGPWFVVTSTATGIYEKPSFEDGEKLGWARNGARIPVEATPASKDRCSGGWYHVVDGGYVCGNQGTVDANDPALKLTMTQPDLSTTLPYKYVRNSKNGTPLYRSVPTRDQMLSYEPYLSDAKDDKQRGGRATADSPAASGTSRDSGATHPEQSASPLADGGNRALQNRIGAALADAGIELPAESPSDEPDASQPWWQRDDNKDELHHLKLTDLNADADDILASRMVAGFYVAVDRRFRWNRRAWYKTTRGLVTPADRFWEAAASDFHGVELGEDLKLPVAWVYGGRKSTTLYRMDGENKPPKSAGSVRRFEPVQLTGRVAERGKRRYHETSGGLWILDAHVRITAPNAPPEDLEAGERWLDVNLEEQTLVAFEGGTPVFATLISTGKESRIKDKDHRTPVGEWRIREKHVTTTMDGDGTAAGDMPYSIEDVPFVMYFHRSYAVHGAFWHSNFGVQMSHGCVNLAPIDAKRLFFFLEPNLPRGWHGVWARRGRPGSRIVIHE